MNTECLGSGEIPTLISQGKEVKKSSSDIGIKPKKFKMLKVKGRNLEISKRKMTHDLQVNATKINN